MTSGERVAALDDAVDQAFDHLRGNPTADRVFYTASSLGDFSVLWGLVGSLRGLRSERDADAAIRLLVCLGVESALVNGLIKSLLPRTRPGPRRRPPPPPAHAEDGQLPVRPRQRRVHRGHPPR